MPRSDKSIARCLGEFVGHVYRGFASSPDDPSEHRHEVGRRTETETRQTPRGPVTIRRTTIEEIDLSVDQMRDAQEPKQP